MELSSGMRENQHKKTTANQPEMNKEKRQKWRSLELNTLNRASGYGTTASWVNAIEGESVQKRNGRRPLEFEVGFPSAFACSCSLEPTLFICWMVCGICG